MRYSKEVIIVIPVYKNRISENEKHSLRQCFAILGRFPVCFVCSHSLKLDCYVKYLPEEACYTIQRFSDNYFTSIARYNRFCLSLNFYKRFKDYRYMFLYQLDAWVFKDELLYWCSRNYDFIGAPWFEGWGMATPASACIGVGNGGFCLRKIESFIRVLHSFAYIIPFISVLRSLKHNPSIKQFLLTIKNLSIANNTFYLFNNYNFQEDYFWGKIAPEKFAWFKVAGKKQASLFALEGNAPYLFANNKQHLPFGCHAWEKYNKDFWMKFINIQE
ncbi:DUF5672 family protein [Parafilimonas sp.]|uniref:DUF5672 family protein n=1 Tax=Parafilimonas sp. TaxID=1969739 RepID=UPI0039E40AB1